MAAAFRAEGLGILLDIVPNHMGIGGASNDFWLDVLAWGRESRFAGWFDIDWEAGGGKLLVPVLGEPYRQALAAGALELGVERRAVRGLGARSHLLPVSPRHWGWILRAGGSGTLAAAGRGARGRAGRRSRVAGIGGAAGGGARGKGRGRGVPGAGGARRADRGAGLAAGEVQPRPRRAELPPVLRDQRPRRGAGRGPGGVRGDAAAGPGARRRRGGRRPSGRPHRRAARSEGIPAAAAVGCGAAVLAAGREDPGRGRGAAGRLGHGRDHRLRGGEPARRAAGRSGRRGGDDARPIATSPAARPRRRRSCGRRSARPSSGCSAPSSRR